MKPYRSKKLTDAAKGQQCALDIPGICIGGTETTVACHSPLLEDRQGAKAPDHVIAFGCLNCHDYLDRRGKLNGDHISEDEQRFFFHRGMIRTLANLIERGIVKI